MINLHSPLPLSQALLAHIHPFLYLSISIINIRKRYVISNVTLFSLAHVKRLTCMYLFGVSLQDSENWTRHYKCLSFTYTRISQKTNTSSSNKAPGARAVHAGHVNTKLISSVSSVKSLQEFKYINTLVVIYKILNPNTSHH